MKKKYKIILGMILLIGILVMNLNFVSPVDAGICCERLDNEGLWCQNVVDEIECDDDYRTLGTSCDQTSFCTPGTCIDIIEGTCTEGTPQQVCLEEYGGNWKAGDKDELPECQYGCCFLGNSASFVTATACSRQSALAGIEDMIFDTSYDNELSCISEVLSDEEGACVYMTDTGMIECIRTTRAECDDTLESGIGSEYNGFHVGYLCSAPELSARCIPTKKTRCEDYDVYFVDSCGNKANIYDADYAEGDNDNYWNYWTYIEETAPCDPDGDGVTSDNEAKVCGSCDYYGGTVCKNYKDLETGTVKPNYGDYICANLDCIDSSDMGVKEFYDEYGRYPKHGERWCANYVYDLKLIRRTYEIPLLNNIQIVGDERFVSEKSTKQQNLPGSRYVVLECRDGEVTPNECDVYRNYVCAEDFYDINENEEQDENEIFAADCVPNRWQDCLTQNESEICEDSTQRDCQWAYVGRHYTLEDLEWLGEFGLDPEEELEEAQSLIPGVCVPKFAPGLNFWEEIDTQAVEDGEDVVECNIASVSCTVTYEGGILGGNPEGRMSKCTSNCYCIPGYTAGSASKKYEKSNSKDPQSYVEWITSMNLICSALGDCGVKVNYIGEKGYYTQDQIIDTSDLR